MALASGLGHTTAIAEETTYGTAVTSGLRGFWVDSNTLTHEKIIAQGGGMRGSGFVAPASRRVVAAEQAGGDLEMDLVTSGMGMLLKHAMGGYSITQQGATPAFLQRFTLADLSTRSLTIQTGMPDTTGALQPYTYDGCMFTEWGITQAQNEIAKFSATVDARSCSVGVGYVTPDYTRAAAAKPFHFLQASVYAGGSKVPGNFSFGLSVTNALKTDRFHTGQAGRKAKPLNNGWAEAVLTVDTEYIDQTTWIARNFTDETFAVVIEYVGAVISGAYTEKLSITCPAVKINGSNPMADDTDVLDHTLELPILSNGVDEPLTIDLQSVDTSA